MSAEHDRIFIKNFSLTIAGLMVFTVLIIILAMSIHNRLELSDAPSRDAARQERLQPYAGVYAGETGRAAAQAAAAEAAAAEPQVAFDGSLDGQLIYDRVCGTCHDSGVAGAPEMQASAWEGRLDKGQDELIANAINGIGAMPPRGGRRNLSDEQIEASVTWMLESLE